MIQRRKERSKERDRRRKKDYGTIVFVLATLETENHSNYTDKEADSFSKCEKILYKISVVQSVFHH